MLRESDANPPARRREAAAPAGRRERSDAPDPAVRLVGSMGEYVAQGQAIRPRVVDPARQQALTDRFLVPALPQLEALLIHLRRELDPVLRSLQPARGGKPYPLGQCLEITEAVRRRLLGVDPAALPPGPAAGLAALEAFVQAGGAVRRAWGDLRGRYFQNALVIGTLYVDVANDTVVTTKPPVEILPFAQAGLSPIVDYAHYGRIAGLYWGRHSLPNHVAPALAPYLPLIEVAANGALRFGPLNTYMLSLTLAERFRPSARALVAPPLPPAVFEGLVAALRGGPLALADSPEAGRAASLAACHGADPESPQAFNAAITGARAADQLLSRSVAIRAV